LDQARLLSRAGLAALAAALTLGVAACGGSDTKTTPTTGGAVPEQPAFTDDRSGLIEPEPARDPANRAPRGASVNYNDPPPPIAAAVKAAADAAKCTVQSFRSEAEPQTHIQGESAAVQSIPPLSGGHNEYWADWGVYNKPIPYKFQLHNLEHGGVVIHYGTDVSVEGVNALRSLWAKSPAFLLVVPDSNPKFPKDAVVVGSQQRWLVCKPFAAGQVPAIKAFVDEYRGRGPEPAAAKNVGGDRPDGLPGPKISDKGAE
jgi:hypothetical protein